MPFAPLVALAVLAVGIAYAQQNLPTPARPPAAEPAPGEAAAPPQDAPAADAGPAAAGPAPAPSAAAGKGSPQRFEPTEKVRPDYDVAFPVDI